MFEGFGKGGLRGVWLFLVVNLLDLVRWLYRVKNFAARSDQQENL